MEQIPLSSSSMAKVCKAAIVNLMLENYKRKQEHKPLIPLIFCYDIEDKKRIITPESIASRETNCNKVITNKELRICHKLCCELEKDPELKAIAEVAKESIKFVKLVGNDATEYKLELIHPFWESPEWETKWKERIATKHSADPSKAILWRDYLKSAINTSTILTADDFDQLDLIGNFYDENANSFNTFDLSNANNSNSLELTDEFI